MNRDGVADDVLQDAVVRRRRAAEIVLGLQSVDRDHDGEASNRAPRLWNLAHRARDELRVDAAGREPGKNHLELAIANERLAAHDRHVQRSIPVDQPDHAVDQLLALEVANLIERDLSAEVIVAVRVAAGATERALAR